MSDWSTTACQSCGANISVHRDWDNPPRLCATCRQQDQPRALLSPGDLIGGRYEVVKRLSAGFAGEVYEAVDRHTGERKAAKIWPRDNMRPPVREYISYLGDVYASLSALGPSAHLLLPTDRGEKETVVYEVFPLLVGWIALNDTIREQGPLEPRRALRIVAKLMEGLAELHGRDLVHADIKPHNVLVSKGESPDVRLIDFGMVRRSSADQPTLLVGTLRYLHPALVDSTRASSSKSDERAVRIMAQAGAYIDIYAAGVLCWEMFTGLTTGNPLFAASDLSAILRDTNPFLRLAPPALVDGVSDMISKLLSVRPGVAVNMALTTAGRAGGLAEGLDSVSRGQPTPATRMDPESLAALDSLKGLESKLSAMANELASATAAFVAQWGTLQPIADGDQFQRNVSEISAVFRNTLARTRSSWQLGVIMTLMCFVTIVAMAGAAVTLSVITRQSQWAMIFGGTSVAVVLGTLIWRPYDRVFQATILTQQIEMIHVQTISTFRATPDARERERVCREAVASLQELIARIGIPTLPRLALAQTAARRQKAREPDQGQLDEISVMASADRRSHR